VACQRYFQEIHGTVFHAKHVSPQMLVWAVGALAEGLGIPYGQKTHAASRS
jgi:hypothetical protein